MSASTSTATVQATTPAAIDNVIAKLLEVRGSRPGKQVNLTEAEIRDLCTSARDIFMNQPVLLELEAPIKICGALSLVSDSLALPMIENPLPRKSFLAFLYSSSDPGFHESQVTYMVNILIC